MEISQGNSLGNYLYPKLAKTSCFSFLSFMFFLLQNQRTGGQNRSCVGGGVAKVGGGQVAGEKGRRMNMVQIMYIHMYVNVTMILAEIVSEIGVGG
jgi:hypothetical protein